MYTIATVSMVSLKADLFFFIFFYYIMNDDCLVSVLQFLTMSANSFANSVSSSTNNLMFILYDKQKINKQ